ncbi:tetratricopeptide repeat protein [Chloroflexia bacterium SDU3-3]|nr:tetratricopeptide repeat protein [Chloroflexia bacterium SDU3-3]
MDVAMSDISRFNQPNWNAQDVYNVGNDQHIHMHSTASLSTPSSYRPVIIPYRRNLAFIGRDRDIMLLDRYFAMPSAVVAITGHGGIGKTQLAVAFAHQCAQDRERWPGGVLWLSMSDPAAIPTAMVVLGAKLEITGYARMSSEEQLAAVRRSLEGQEPRLLVFDNCEDPSLLRLWWPASGAAKVLITSRSENWNYTQVVLHRLSSLPRAASCELLMTPRARWLQQDVRLLADSPLVNQICEELGDHALALHLAGSYLAENPRTTLDMFLAEFGRHHLNLPSLTKIDPQSPTEYPRALADTIALSFQLLKPGDSVDRQAIAVLDVTAHLALDKPIPTTLFCRVSGMSLDELDAAMQRLCVVGLASNGRDNTILVHRLVAIYARLNQADIQKKQIVKKIAGVIVDMGQRLIDEGHPKAIAALLSHITHVVKTSALFELPHTGALSGILGVYYEHIADYAKARESYEQAIHADERYYGVDDVHVSGHLKAMGHLLAQMNRLEDAQIYYQRAAEISLQALQVGEMQGDSRPSTARRVRELGAAYCALGNFIQAHLLYARALVIDEEIFGPMNLVVADDCHDLGKLLKQLGDLPMARTYLARALAIYEAYYGSEHVMVVSVLISLGRVVKASKDMDAAAQLYERALQMAKRICDRDDPMIATILTNLGSVAQSQGQAAKAEIFYQEALRINEAHYGPSHPYVAKNAYNLGSIAFDSRDRRKAQVYFQQARDIYMTRFPLSHPQVANVCAILFQLESELWEVEA